MRVATKMIEDQRRRVRLEALTARVAASKARHGKQVVKNFARFCADAGFPLDARNLRWTPPGPWLDPMKDPQEPSLRLSQMKGAELFLATQQLREKYKGKPVPPDFWRDYFTQEEYDAIRAEQEHDRLVMLKYGITAPVQAADA